MSEVHPFDPNAYVREQRELRREEHPHGLNGSAMALLAPLPPLEFIDHSDIGSDLPIRPFLVEKWVPLGCVTSLYGSGGTGKSFLAMMLGMCVAAGQEWLGYTCEQAVVLGLMCEDDEDELKRRRNKIARALRLKREDIEGRLFLSPRIGEHNALMEFPSGIANRTPLFERIVEDAKRLGARLIILDNAAQLFAGNENDRSQVTAFLNAVGGIAREVNGSVLLLGHPPKIQNNQYSGSTAWDAVVRSRIWFKRTADENGAEEDGKYTLELVKSNYARRFGVELAENTQGVVEYVKDIDPKKFKTSKPEKTFNALFDLYSTLRRAIALDELVEECIRLGIVAEAEIATNQWRDRRRTIRAHLAQLSDRVDDRKNETYALKPCA